MKRLAVVMGLLALGWSSGCVIDQEKQFDIEYKGDSENAGGQCPDNGNPYSDSQDVPLDSNLKVKSFEVVSWVGYIDSYTEGAEPGQFWYTDYGLAAAVDGGTPQTIVFAGQFANECPASEVHLTPDDLPQTNTCLAKMAQYANENETAHAFIKDVLNSSNPKVAVGGIGNCSGEFNISYRTVLTVKGVVTLK